MLDENAGNFDVEVDDPLMFKVILTFEAPTFLMEK